MAELMTVMSAAESGRAEVKVHSSSAVLVGGAADGVGSRSKRVLLLLEGGAGDAVDLMDCWNWNGDPWRGVEVLSAAKGSADLGACPIGTCCCCWKKGWGGGEAKDWDGPGLTMDPKGS